MRAITAHIKTNCDRESQSFVEGTRQLDEIATLVTVAKIHVGNSLQKLKTSKECLVEGTLSITYRRRRFERMKDLRDRLQWLRGLVHVQEDVARACGECRFADALRIVLRAAQCLEEPRPPCTP